MKKISVVAGSLRFFSLYFTYILVGYLYISYNKRLHSDCTNYLSVSNQYFIVIYAGKLLIQCNLDYLDSEVMFRLKQLYCTCEKAYMRSTMSFLFPSDRFKDINFVKPILFVVQIISASY